MMTSANTLWHRDGTMRYLNAYPLPDGLKWPHRDGGDQEVKPSHGMVIGYGKWLRETPYFPGLFELCHDLLEEAPGEFSTEWLPAQVEAARKKFEGEPGTPGEHLAHKIRRLRLPSNQPTLFE